MKKTIIFIIIALVLVWIVTVISCISHDRVSAANEFKLAGQLAGTFKSSNIYIFILQGHEYLMIRDGQFQSTVAVVHHERCPCK